MNVGVYECVRSHRQMFKSQLAPPAEPSAAALLLLDTAARLRTTNAAHGYIHVQRTVSVGVPGCSLLPVLAQLLLQMMVLPVWPCKALQLPYQSTKNSNTRNTW